MILIILAGRGESNKALINMDLTQTDHLKAYGLVYWLLQQNQNVEWLLNYRGGSFLVDYSDYIANECRLRGVTFERTDGATASQIYSLIQEENMDIILLEKAPRIAIYTPPNKQPWDDAVTLALTYAEVDYSKIWDKEVLRGKLEDYDWLHLHHEDFTGQYNKFFYSFRNTEWYVQEKILFEKIAAELGYSKVSDEKKDAALRVREYVERGGFLFAMCLATNTLDIALASQTADIVPQEFDGDGIDPNFQKKLNFDRTFAFQNFKIETNPLIPVYDDIDVNRVNTPERLEALDFTLFDFAAKYDPVPSMLVQNHVNHIKGFYGLLTSYNRKVLKKSVVFLGESDGTDQVKYIHGNFGKGQFTFLGGHDPEDKQHLVGDPPTQLSLNKNSPGYRLILNNILFPAARKKKLKT